MRAKVTWTGGTKLDCETSEVNPSMLIGRWPIAHANLPADDWSMFHCRRRCRLENREFGQVWVDLDADRKEEYPRFTKST